MSGYAENRSHAVTNEVVGIAERLRRLANEVESQAAIKPDIRTMRLNHVKTAAEVIHKVTWGVANLHLDALVSLAAEADSAAQRVAEDDETSDGVISCNCEQVLWKGRMTHLFDCAISQDARDRGCKVGF